MPSRSRLAACWVTRYDAVWKAGLPVSNPERGSDVPSERPYNPLDKKNLGISVADALLHRDPVRLPPDRFDGAGVYAIYYIGSFDPYNAIAKANRQNQFAQPVYVGKAVPPGRRRGGLNSNENPGPVLSARLRQHANSIEQANNLDLKDFWCRHLVVDDIWIPLGESLLINRFAPIWNRLIDGFGNHDPGSGRYNQARSRWDVLHPGRPWADRLKLGHMTLTEIVELLSGSQELA